MLSFLLSTSSINSISLDIFCSRASQTMARFNWAQVLLATTSLVYATDSTTTSGQGDGLSASATATSTVGTVGTFTVSGSTGTYAIPATLPASVDIGPNLLPNVDDPQAKNAQALCPGYKAVNVQNTTDGFKAILRLAGEPVSIKSRAINDE